jgi:UDP-glucose:(heptosyl)LPS alpha-1,3-glucosyltransferase
MLQIGILVDRWQPSRGGAERALADLASFLEAHGHRVQAFAERGPPRDEDAPGQLHLVRPRGIALSRGARERRLAEALVNAADAEGCDVTIGVRHLPRVDLYWPHGGSHAASVAASRAARAWKPGRSVDIEPIAMHGRHRAFVEFETELLERGGARAVACVSALVAEELAIAFPACANRSFLAPNGVDLVRFHPREREQSGAELRRALAIDGAAPVITIAARNPVLKGLPVLLSALKSIEREPWTLVVAGTRDVEAWKRRVREAGIAGDRVRVLRDADAVAFAAASDVCVLPTWRDTCGLVALEALATGVPVITTSRAGVRECIDSSSGTVIENPGDVDALARAIRDWLERARGGKVDRERVRARVLGRGRETWLAALEARLVELAR